jgi:hypothetical protein
MLDYGRNSDKKSHHPVSYGPRGSDVRSDITIVPYKW